VGVAVPNHQRRKLSWRKELAARGGCGSILRGWESKGAEKPVWREGRSGNILKSKIMIDWNTVKDCVVSVAAIAACVLIIYFLLKSDDK
jgi:hypothetical protein